jgi:hypothetical protein
MGVRREGSKGKRESGDAEESQRKDPKKDQGKHGCSGVEEKPVAALRMGHTGPWPTLSCQLPLRILPNIGPSVANSLFIAHAMLIGPPFVLAMLRHWDK